MPDDTGTDYRNYRTFKHLLYAASQGSPGVLDFLATYEPSDYSGMVDIYDEPTTSLIRLLAASFDPYQGSKRNMNKAAQMLRKYAREMNTVAEALEKADPYTEAPENLKLSDTCTSFNKDEKWEVLSFFKYWDR